MGMEFTQYTASEDDGTIELCAVVMDGCIIPFEFTIYLTTSGASGN